MSSTPRKNSAVESKARLEMEIRAIVSKLAHHPIEDIVIYIRERGIAVDPAFVAEILGRPTCPRH